jgi:integrase
MLVSVRKRVWTTARGEVREAWVVALGSGKNRHLKTFVRKRDADAYQAKAKVDISAGIHVAESRSSTVAEAGQQWLTSREAAGIEPTTLAQYRQHLELHITPLIGTKKLSILTVPLVRQFEDQLRQKGCSAVMVKKILVSLSGILNDALDRGNVAQNVVRHRRGQRNGDTRHQHRLAIGKDIPTLAEIRAMIAGLTGGRERPLLLTAIFTGLRASELRGLRWPDIDLAKGELHVRQRADRFGTLGSPKSAGSRRTVPLLPMVANALKAWRLACPPNAAELVFPGEHGPLDWKTLARYWHAAQIAAGVVAGGGAKYPGLHALRHFFASWCINRKADGGLELPLKLVQARLGHATIAMTADRYSHLFPRGDDAAEMRAAERALMTVV